MISVIIPVYNGEAVIGRCLESLEKQTKKPDEVIVIDDGSTDGTKGIVRSFAAATLLEQNHAGPAAARNLGARKAAGDIILFTDADCVPEKGWVEWMAKPFEDKEVSGVQGVYRTEQKSLTARFAQLEIEDRYEKMKSFESIDFIGTYSAGYRRGIFLEFGGFDEAFSMASGEDPELSFKLAEAGHKMVLSPAAAVSHKHPDTFGKYMKQKFYRAYWRNLLYKKHKKKAIKETYTPQSLKAQMGFFYAAVLSLALSPLYSVMFYAAAASVVAMFLLTIPFSIKNCRKDIAVGVASPFFVVSRTAALGAGMAYGFIKLRRLLFVAAPPADMVAAGPA